MFENIYLDAVTSNNRAKRNDFYVDRQYLFDKARLGYKTFVKFHIDADLETSVSRIIYWNGIITVATDTTVASTQDKVQTLKKAVQAQLPRIVVKMKWIRTQW